MKVNFAPLLMKSKFRKKIWFSIITRIIAFQPIN